MINIFQIADNDQSIYYLGQIFGNVGIALSGSGPALLSVMFRTFNSALLVIGALVVTYVTVLGVLNTAHQGKFMGEKFNSLWMPIRIVGGIAALVPTSSGYCVAQVIMMWFIVQGIGAADMVWKSAVEYLGHGGATHTPPPVDMVNRIPTVMQNLFADLVCQQAVIKIKKNDPNAVAYATLNADNTGYQFGRPKDTNDPATVVSECGTVVWGQDDGTGKQKALGAAIKTIVPTLQILANQYVTQIINDANCWEPCTDTDKITKNCTYFDKYKSLNITNPSCSAGNSQTAWNSVLSYAGSNFMSDSVKLFSGFAYNYAAVNKVKNQPNIPGTTISSDLDKSYQRAQANGWIFAGAYYYYIAQQNNGVQDDFENFLSAIGGALNIANNDTNERFNNPDVYPDLSYSSSSGIQPTLVKNFYCGNLTKTFSCPPSPGGDPCSAQAYIGGGLGVATMANNAMNCAIKKGGGIWIQSSSGGGEGAGPSAPLNSVANMTIRTWVNNISGDANTNPLISIQSFGHQLLIAAEVLFWIFFGVVLVLGWLSTNVIVAGFSANPLAGVSAAILTYLMPVAFALIVYMITIGGLLGVYLPLLPYIFFTFAAIGWMIAALEAIIAGPLIALTVLSPGGHHDILGRAENSVMLLLNVCIRPTLMLFGLFAGMLMSYVVINFINAAFYNVVGSVVGGSMGLIEAFLFIIAYAGIVITALSKCFSLIFLVPDRVLRWIGGQHESYGEEHAAQEVKGKVGAGSEAAGSGAKQMGSKGEHHGAFLERGLAKARGAEKKPDNMGLEGKEDK